MPTLIRARVPYQVDIVAADTQSGKRISNILYYASITGGGYGAGTASTDEATFLASVLARWVNFIDTTVSDHYTMLSIRARAIYGWLWPTPKVDVVGFTPGGLFSTVATGSPHGFADGYDVSIVETAGVTGLNAVHSAITVTGPTSFTIPPILAGTLSVVGTAQRVFGNRQFEYVDNLEVPDSTPGGIAGECVPLAIAASCRRLNAGVGRNWRSHISLAPILEADQENGRFKTASYTAWQTAVDALNNDESAGGGVSLGPIVVSRRLAFLQASPFTDATNWTRAVSDHSLRKNLGTCTSRKPKLTAIIA